MKVEVVVGERRYALRLDCPSDLSIPIRFAGPRASAFGIGPAVARPFEADGFVGEVALGGSVNCRTITLTPHGNGTHTECLGHLTAEEVDVLDMLRDAIVPALVITVAPRVVRLPEADFPQPVLTRERIAAELARWPGEFRDAVVIRTLPNDSIKTRMEWGGTGPPWVAPDAMELLAESGVRHLLLDLPSADPERDEGRLLAHRAFWREDRHRTITELIYVPNEVADGPYVLNLQVAPIAQDAAPSRPLLFSLEEVA
jgi:kynurenine formamidase